MPGAVIYNPDEFKPVKKVSIDSRNISKNTLFVAIKGKRTDGHKYIKEAITNGASAVMISKRE